MTIVLFAPYNIKELHGADANARIKLSYQESDMARYYGSGSKYLLTGELKNFLFAAGLVVVPIGIIFVVLNHFQPTATIAVGLLLIAVVAVGLEPLTDYFENRSAKFYRGRHGEKEIKKTLMRLPDEYAVFQGVVTDRNRGDIDFVVVGPTGIFVIEVKSMGGRIEFDGARLTVNGNYDGRDFLRQASGEAWAIKRYVQSYLRSEIYVHAVLAFTHPYASMRFGLQPVDNVHVVHKDYLLELIRSFAPYQYRVSRQAVERILLSLVAT